MAIIDLTKENFQAEITKSDKPVSGRFLGCMVRSVSDDGTDSS